MFLENLGIPQIWNLLAGPNIMIVQMTPSSLSPCDLNQVWAYLCRCLYSTSGESFCLSPTTLTGIFVVDTGEGLYCCSKILEFPPMVSEAGLIFVVLLQADKDPPFCLKLWQIIGYYRLNACAAPMQIAGSLKLKEMFLLWPILACASSCADI